MDDLIDEFLKKLLFLALILILFAVVAPFVIGAIIGLAKAWWWLVNWCYAEIMSIVRWIMSIVRWIWPEAGI